MHSLHLVSKSLNEVSKLLTPRKALGQAQSKVSCDSSKFCFSVYSNEESGSTFGVALPSNVTDPYDVVLSITAPIANYWTGFSWGGNMVWNPLSVVWPNGKTVTPSSRFAL